jgi:lambda repressor-like predicted transcriptional regulator
MTPFEIKVALMKEGTSMRAIAKRLGVSANSISLVVNKRMVSRRIMEEVAKVVRAEKACVFPEYFNHKSDPVLQ